jgi:hypothetical protein
MKQLESQPKLGHVTPGAAEAMDHLKHWQFALFKFCTVKIGGRNIKGPAHEIYSLFQVSTYENQEPGLKLNLLNHSPTTLMFFEPCFSHL